MCAIFCTHGKLELKDKKEHFLSKFRFSNIFPNLVKKPVLNVSHDFLYSGPLIFSNECLVKQRNAWFFEIYVYVDVALASDSEYFFSLTELGFTKTILALKEKREINTSHQLNADKSWLWFVSLLL